MAPVSKERYQLLCDYLWKIYGKTDVTLSEVDLKDIVGKGLGINTRRKETWNYHLDRFLSDNILTCSIIDSKKAYRVVNPEKRWTSIDIMKALIE